MRDPESMRGMEFIRGPICGIGSVRGVDSERDEVDRFVCWFTFPVPRTDAVAPLTPMPDCIRVMTSCRLWLARFMAARCAGLNAIVRFGICAGDGRITRRTFAGGIGRPGRRAVPFVRTSAEVLTCVVGVVTMRRCVGGMGMGGRD